MSSALPFCCCFYFFWRFSIIHHCCWPPLKHLLLHPLSQRSHAIVLLILKFVAMVQPSSSQLCPSAPPSLLFFLHEFIQTLSGSLVSCLCFHFSDYSWSPFDICFLLLFSSSSRCHTPGSSKSNPRHIKAEISENKFKQRSWLQSQQMPSPN